MSDDAANEMRPAELRSPPPEPVAFQTLGDLEDAAAARASPEVWAYVQGGAGEERTVAANRAAFRRWALRPRALVNVSHIDLRAPILGETVRAPFFVSPTAYQGLVHPDGEVGLSRAAADEGVLAVFSTMSSASLETIAEARPGAPRWFQLYLQPDWAASRRLVERAERAGYGAVVLTVDAPILGNRDRETRAGFGYGSGRAMGNGPDVVGPSRTPTLGEGDGSRDERIPTWDVVDRLREATALPIVLKGILTAEDARRAAEHGVRGIVVSNHGGRQLDGATAALDALPDIVAAIGSRLEVYVDGGARRGSDIAIALALGARAVGLGRPALWALAAGGGPGVARWISLLKNDLASVLAVSGRRSVLEIDGSFVHRAP
jgi:4-hydroxymandelate oxidase